MKCYYCFDTGCEHCRPEDSGVSPKKSWVIAYGDIFGGLQGIMGPFTDYEVAEKYLESHNFGHFEKALIGLEEPAGGN